MYLSRRLLGLTALLSASAAAPAPTPDMPSGKIEQVPPQQALAILGLPVSEQDGKTVGRLVDVLIDAAGTPEAAIIDFGGFMGVGARKVAVHWSTLHFAPGDAKHPITLDLTPDQMKAAPEYKDPTRSVPVVVPDTTPATARDDATPPAVPPAPR
jgi:PRC-barrel domain